MKFLSFALASALLHGIASAAPVNGTDLITVTPLESEPPNSGTADCQPNYDACALFVQVWGGTSCSASQGSNLVALGRSNGAKRTFSYPGRRSIRYTGGQTCGKCPVSSAVIALYDQNQVYMGDLDLIIGVKSACFVEPRGLYYFSW